MLGETLGVGSYAFVPGSTSHALEARGTGDCVVAYVPVLHDGYRRFLEEHGRGKPLHLIGPELYVDFRPLAKDVRALDAQLVALADAVSTERVPA